jgi:1-hydroxy-2-naphthoate dioxygenase
MSMVGTTIEELDAFLAEQHLLGKTPTYKAPPPRKGNTAAHWKWEGIYEGLMQSANLISVGPDGDTGMRSVTGVEARAGGRPIWLNTQIVMPGERTECHRTMRSETRLVLQASPGAVFVCEFEAYPMERGDVIISPPYTYHDHWNEGTEPAIFVDGYDNGWNPNVINIGGKLPDGAAFQQITRPSGYTTNTMGHVRRMYQERPFPLPPMRYRWAETQAALDTLRESEGYQDPYDGIHLMLASPVDNGPTLPTIAWQVQLLMARQNTRPHRHNSNTFYCVFEGEGTTVIEGERLEWHQGDLFAVPPWKWHSHENASGDDAILFSIDDWPAMQKLGFYMEENDG